MKTKIGIVGAGRMLKYYAQGFRSAGAEITCIADINPAVASKASKIFQIPKIFDSLDEMIDQSANLFTAVSILTPPLSHKSIAVKALKAGKHVFCEKPPALNANEVFEMKKAAELAGRLLVFNFNNRLRPEAIKIKKMIKNDFFGRINSSQAVWMRPSGIPAFGTWFTDKAIAGGGALIDLLHVIDLALYFMEYPEPNYVSGQTFDTFMDDPAYHGFYGELKINGTVNVESSAHAFVSFKSGQALSLHCSWAEMIKEEECFVAFQGQKAGAKISRPFDPLRQNTTGVNICELYTRQRNRHSVKIIPACFDNSIGRIGAATNFVKAIRKKSNPTSTPDEAYKLMRIIDAVYLSAKTNKPVLLSKKKEQSR